MSVGTTWLCQGMVLVETLCLLADKTRLEVGGLQSTSNIIVDDHVVIDTDYPLLWMTELHDSVA